LEEGEEGGGELQEGEGGLEVGVRGEGGAACGGGLKPGGGGVKGDGEAGEDAVAEGGEGDWSGRSGGGFGGHEETPSIDVRKRRPARETRPWSGAVNCAASG
jgi:hypothetical protein